MKDSIRFDDSCDESLDDGCDTPDDFERTPDDILDELDDGCFSTDCGDDADDPAEQDET